MNLLIHLFHLLNLIYFIVSLVTAEGEMDLSKRTIRMGTTLRPESAWTRMFQNREVGSATTILMMLRVYIRGSVSTSVA